MADWSLPALTSTYTNTLTEIKNRDVDLALQFDGTTTTSIPTGAIRWTSSANTWQKWTGSAWGALSSTFAFPAITTSGDQSIVAQHNGNSNTWYGRVLSKNATADKAAFLGTYGNNTGIFAHNNALNAWADLYVNTTDGGNASAGAVRLPSTVFLNGNQALHAGNYSSYSPTLTGTGASGTWGINVTGSAVNLSTTRNDWVTNGTISAVVGQLAWKNYGNGHTIFDASNGTSPNGGAVNTTNSTLPWSSTYPTLMGWNGLDTYGVRVDSARRADSAASADTCAGNAANVTGTVAIANGGTGQTSAAAALAALLPSQSGQAGKALTTNGAVAAWDVIAFGASIQTFTASGTYIPTASKTTFLVFVTGGGGGGWTPGAGSSGGAAGTAVRLYNTTELGSSASITIGAGGTATASGGSSSFTPAGTVGVMSGLGGGAASSVTAGGSAGTTSGTFSFGLNGQKGMRGFDAGTSASTVAPPGGASFWGGGYGAGGDGPGGTGVSGFCLILEW